MADYFATSGSLTKTNGKVDVTVDWSYTQGVVQNQTYLHVNVEVECKEILVSSSSGSVESKVSATNATVFSDTFDCPLLSYGIRRTLLSKTYTLNHDANGVLMTSDLDVECYGISVYIGNIYFKTIDRKAPTITVNAAPLTTYADITVTTDVECDVFQYSTNNGSTWTNAATVGDIAFTKDTTSAKFRIAGLTKETSYNVKIRARRKYNQVYGSSGTLSVKTIGRTTVSALSLSDADNATVTANITALVYDKAHYQKIGVYLGSTLLFTTSAFQLTCNNTISDQTVNTVASSTTTISFTAAERNKILTAMTNLTGANLKLRLYTYSDSGCGTQIGSYVEKTAYTKTTEAKSKPTFTAFTYEDSNTATKSVTGNNQVLVQHYSNLIVKCATGTAKNGATIVKYEASIGKSNGNSSGTTIDVGTVAEKDEQILTVTCTDSRGYSVSLTETIRIIPYIDPCTTSFTLRRRDGVGELIQLDIRGNRSKIDATSGTDTNGFTQVRFRYRNTSETQYSDWVSLLSIMTITGNTFSYSTNELMELDAEKSYMFHFQIRDKIGEASSYDYYVVLEQGIPVISIRGRSSSHTEPYVGINNPNPKYPLDVGGLIAMNGNVVLGYGGTLKSGETITSKNKGGIFYYDATYEASDAPVKEQAIVMAVSAGPVSFILFVVLSTGIVHIKSYNGTSWTQWKQL
ncbi:MAG: hypothetical protein IJE19_03100 [Clostridia bacterium]|nr:hypothetical protein [Clostridia bacterium]